MICSSFSYPNMFDVARSKVNLYTDTISIVNRVKLLLLTEPTELYMSPNFGVGLKQFMYTYNNDNTIAMIRSKLVDQLRLWEPAVVPDETKVTRGSTSTGPTDFGLDTSVADLNHLKLTISLVTKYMDTVSFGIDSSDFTRIY